MLAIPLALMWDIDGHSSCVGRLALSMVTKLRLRSNTLDFRRYLQCKECLLKEKFSLAAIVRRRFSVRRRRYTQGSSLLEETMGWQQGFCWGLWLFSRSVFLRLCLQQWHNANERQILKVENKDQLWSPTWLWRPKQKILFSSQIHEPRALILCRRREMEGIKGIKFFCFIFSLYNDPHIYKNS